MMGRMSSGYIFPPGGGGDTEDSEIAWTLVDLTDGSWTSADPTGWIASVTKVGDAMLFVNNTVSGSADHAPNSGTNFDAYRAYKALTYPDGTAVTTSDRALLSTSIKWISPSGTRANQQDVNIGMAIDPASTVRNNILLSGAVQRQLTGSVNLGAVRTTGATLSGTGTPTGVIGTADLGGDAYAAVMYENFNAAGARVASNALINGVTLTAAQPVYICVQVGSNSTNSAVAGRENQLEFRYAIRKQTIFS